MVLVGVATTSAPTPDREPWNRRLRPQRLGDSARSSYEVDRDRVIHCSTFRDLQYKTQVQSLLSQKPSQVFRTRLTHVLEVAQIARAIARLTGADEALSEAIALAHDLGHPPFGHAGERALGDALRHHGREGWNANLHSLEVVDRVEAAFTAFRGLNLTYAVREGIARHSTPFDEPISFGEFAATPNGGIECQIVDVADVFAYLSHDLDDALAGAYLSLDEVAKLETMEALIEYADKAWEDEHSRAWPETEKEMLVRKHVIATLLHRLINDTAARAGSLIKEMGVTSADDVRQHEQRVIVPSADHEELVRTLLGVLTRRYYRSDAVAGADQAAHRLVTGLLDYMLSSPDVVPERFRDGDAVLDAATYLASLNDFAAVDLARSAGLDVPDVASEPG